MKVCIAAGLKALTRLDICDCKASFSRWLARTSYTEQHQRSKSVTEMKSLAGVIWKISTCTGVYSRVQFQERKERSIQGWPSDILYAITSNWSKCSLRWILQPVHCSLNQFRTPENRYWLQKGTKTQVNFKKVYVIYWSRATNLF